MIQAELLEGCAMHECIAYAAQLIVGHRQLLQGSALVQAEAQVLDGIVLQHKCIQIGKSLQSCIDHPPHKLVSEGTVYLD